MKTISVKQVAEALNLTTRAVVYRLEKGQLKGTQQPNAFGKQEWRVYPTKEIIEGLKNRQGAESKDDAEGSEPINFSPDGVDIVDADQVVEEEDFRSSTGYSDQDQLAWQELAKDTLKGLAEELVRPLGETIRAQQNLLAEKDRIIAEKDQQIRLLPDLQKQAEEERRAAELKELEAAALRKQIEAMEVEKQQAEEARRSSEEEIERLKEEKEAQLQAVQEQLQTLSATVQELKQPWWKKMFGTAGDVKKR